MKKCCSMIITLFLLIMAFGCNSSNVKNPPSFVEMHVGEEGDFVDLKSENASRGLVLLDEITTAEPTTTVTTVPVEVAYEASIYSHTDFEIVIITRGVNYDLLYSVELSDSILGTCVYTDQSLLYKANSTIITETDGSYRTEITLTIPGSTDHDVYLSNRVITLTKILFTRDTADGTFPADIPNNSETVLTFEVHARKYLDETVGLPLIVNEGKVDVIAMPDGDYYDEARTLAKALVTIPASINGYQVGKVVLWDVDWVETLNINGASENVVLLGDFAEMSALSIHNLTRLATEDDAYLIFSGDFAQLESIEIGASSDYRIEMVKLSGIQYEDQHYAQYYATLEEDLNEFPALASLEIDGVSSAQFRMGSPTLVMDFPALLSIVVNNSSIDGVTIGSELNNFPLLDTITVSDSLVSTFQVCGTMPEENAPAMIEIEDSSVLNEISVRGSIIGALVISGSDLGGMQILDGSVEASKFASLTISDSEFEAAGAIQIKGDHPLLTEVNFADLACGDIVIGSVEDVFAALESITFTNVAGSYIKIGDRDTSFPVLTEVELTNVDLTGNFRIGYEMAHYDALETISVIGLTANDLTIGRHEEEFTALILVYCEDIDLEGDFLITGGDGYTDLETLVFKNFEADSFSHQGSGGSFDVYFEGFTCASGPYINSDCFKVYVPNSDVTTWAYYEAVTLAGHTVESGTYTP